MLSIAEKEAIMGMPVDYTLHANTKQQRKSNPQGCDDDRMTLVGNAWHVGVVAFLLSNLLAKEGFCSPVSPKDLVNHLKSGSSVSLSGLLFSSTTWRKQPTFCDTTTLCRTGNCIGEPYYTFGFCERYRCSVDF
jgi:hypothetical protein